MASLTSTIQTSMFLFLGSMGVKKGTHSPSGLVILNILKSSSNSTDDIPIIMFHVGRVMKMDKVRGRLRGMISDRFIEREIKFNR